VIIPTFSLSTIETPPKRRPLLEILANKVTIPCLLLPIYTNTPKPNCRGALKGYTYRIDNYIKPPINIDHDV